MKQFFFVMIAVALVAGCKKVEKDVYNYFPKVKTVGAVVQPDGSIRLTGELLSSGAGEMRGVGFCMDTLPNPRMEDNQQICDTLFGNSFSTLYVDLDATRKYYFRTWAVNEWGYAYGEDILVDNISLDTSIIPCHPAPSTMSMTDFGTVPIYSVTNLEYTTFQWECSAYTNNGMFHLTFYKWPTAGVYEITELTSISSKEKRFVNLEFSQTYAKAGKVYINQISPTLIEVTICEAMLPKFNGNRYLIARFTVKT